MKATRIAALALALLLGGASLASAQTGTPPPHTPAVPDGSRSSSSDSVKKPGKGADEMRSRNVKPKKKPIVKKQKAAKAGSDVRRRGCENSACD